MQFLENAWNNITNKLSEHFERKRQEQEEFERMKRQAEFESRIAWDIRQKEKAHESARQEALERASKETGIGKLRAINRAKRLDNLDENSFFSKLSQHTQRNIKRSQENKERSKFLREEARKMREDTLRKRQQERMERMERNKNRRQW